jgi:hypothetical protein
MLIAPSYGTFCRINRLQSHWIVRIFGFQRRGERYQVAIHCQRQLGHIFEGKFSSLIRPFFRKRERSESIGRVYVQSDVLDFGVVIPAKAGIHCENLDPRLRGDDGHSGRLCATGCASAVGWNGLA